MRAHKNPKSENRELSIQATIPLQSLAFAGFVLFSVSCYSCKRELQGAEKYLGNHTKERVQESTGLFPTFACMDIILIIITNTLVTGHHQGQI